MQHSAGTCPNSWRDGFARDCPLRHPVAWVLALRDRSGAHRRFLVVCGAISAVAGEAPEKRGTTEARWQPVCRRSSREPGFVVRGGRSRDTRPRKADGGSDLRPAECCRPGESARGMDPSYIPRLSRIKFLIGLAEGLLGRYRARTPGSLGAHPRFSRCIYGRFQRSREEIRSSQHRIDVLAQRFRSRAAAPRKTTANTGRARVFPAPDRACLLRGLRLVDPRRLRVAAAVAADDVDDRDVGAVVRVALAAIVADHVRPSIARRRSTTRSMNSQLPPRLWQEFCSAPGCWFATSCTMWNILGGLPP